MNVWRGKAIQLQDTSILSAIARPSAATHARRIVDPSHPVAILAQTIWPRDFAHAHWTASCVSTSRSGKVACATEPQNWLADINRATLHRRHHGPHFDRIQHATKRLKTRLAQQHRELVHDRPASAGPARPRDALRLRYPAGGAGRSKRRRWRLHVVVRPHSRARIW